MIVHPHAHVLTFICALTHTVMIMHSHPCTHIHNVSLQPHTYTHALSLSFSLSLSLSHTKRERERERERLIHRKRHSHIHKHTHSPLSHLLIRTHSYQTHTQFMYSKMRPMFVQRHVQITWPVPPRLTHNIRAL